MHWLRWITFSLLFCFCFGTNISFANTKDEITWNWAAGMDVIYQQLREETLHKLRNHGPAFSFNTQLLRTSPSNDHSILFHIPVGLLIDRYNYPVISLQYGLETYGLWHAHRRFSFGYMAAFNARYRYFPEWDDAHLYWLTDYSIGPAFEYHIPYKKDLRLYIDFALASLVSRPPQQRRNKFDNILTLSGFFSVPQQDLSMKNVSNFQTGKIRIYYDKLAHSFYYEGRLARTNEDLNFVEIWHSLGWRYVF